MKVVFRADSSARIGSGHAMRCLTLAEQLRERDAEVRFVCRDHSGSLIPVIQSRRIPTAVLPPPASNDGDDYAAWLGVSQAVDAAQRGEHASVPT